MTTPYAVNLLLAFAWAALFNSFSIGTLIVGFVVGYAVIGVLQPLFGNERYCQRLLGLLSLALFFVWELLLSSFRVAWDVLTPVQRSRPALVRVPLQACSELEATVLANLISLTPGSLSVDISDDRRALLVHGMFVDDPDDLRHEIRSGMERRVLEALR